jgi:hypothetical protein
MRDGGVAAEVSRGNAWLKLGRRLLAGRQTGAVAPEADPQGVGLGDDGETRETMGVDHRIGPVAADQAAAPAQGPPFGRAHLNGSVRPDAPDPERAGHDAKGSWLSMGRTLDVPAGRKTDEIRVTPFGFRELCASSTLNRRGQPRSVRARPIASGDAKRA